MARVSVVVPFYNAERYIDTCLASIDAQTFKDIELILIDDSQGAGAWAARNRGIERAKGEFVVFCDADDYLSHDAVENLVKAADGVELVVGSFRKFGEWETVVSESGIRTASEVAEYAMGNLLNPRSNQVLSGCWAKLYRRELVDSFPALTTAEDMAFNYDYLRRCKKVSFIPTVVYHNRKRQGSLSTTYDERNKPGLFGYLGGLRHVKGFLSEFYSEDQIDNAVDNSKVYHSMLYFGRICNQLGLSPNETLRRLYP